MDRKWLYENRTVGHPKLDECTTFVYLNFSMKQLASTCRCCNHHSVGKRVSWYIPLSHIYREETDK